MESTDELQSIVRDLEQARDLVRARARGLLLNFAVDLVFDLARDLNLGLAFGRDLDESLGTLLVRIDQALDSLAEPEPEDAVAPLLSAAEQQRVATSVWSFRCALTWLHAPDVEELVAEFEFGATVDYAQSSRSLVLWTLYNIRFAI